MALLGLMVRCLIHWDCSEKTSAISVCFEDETYKLLPSFQLHDRYVSAMGTGWQLEDKHKRILILCDRIIILLGLIYRDIHESNTFIEPLCKSIDALIIVMSGDSKQSRESATDDVECLFFAICGCSTKNECYESYVRWECVDE